MDEFTPDRATLLTLQLKPSLEAVVSSCLGTYLCDCEACRAEKAALVRRGVRPIRQPVKYRRAA